MTRGTRQIPKALKKDWRKLAEAMREQGWTFEQPKHGHPHAYAPDGIAHSPLPGTPGDQAGLRNARATFRRWCRENGREPGI